MELRRSSRTAGQGGLTIQPQPKPRPGAGVAGGVKRKPFVMKSNEQYCLDFGQKNIDPIRCKTCGMLYVMGEETDEKQHAKFHREFDEGVRWLTRIERPMKYFDDGGRIVSIQPNDPVIVFVAVNKLLKMSEGEMSTGNDLKKLFKKEGITFLVYVTQHNNMIGYICVEKINKSYELLDYDSSRISDEPLPAECGILYLWVHPVYRLRGIGTWLTDIGRANLVKDKIIPRSRVAVCDPTESAVPFLKAYLLNKRPVKVYQD